MDPLLIAGLALLAILALLIVIIVIRAIMFVPKKRPEVKASPVFVNTEKAAGDLAEMIRCKTISSTDKSLEDESEFLKFERLLPTLFPKVFEKCSFEKVSDRALLFKWEGRAHDAPTVLMSHYDVVSVDEDKWDKPAFSGIIENGVLWGRGTLDTKGTLNGVLQATEQLITEGFVPENDIYFAFGGDEEINGHGAKDIVALFKARGITPGIVVDEGGAVVNNVVPGVRVPTALIGISEKGMANIQYSVTGGGGHASAPAKNTPVGRLARACARVEKHPFKYNLTKPAAQFFDTVCRHSTFLYRLIFANLWCFGPALDLLGRLSGGEINAMVRTTTAFTQMQGSQGANVIPPYAYMVSNHRIADGETVDSLLLRIKKTVKDEKVEIKVLTGVNPPPVSRTDCEAWERISAATAEVWQDAVVSPYYMLACSDSRNWGEISDKVYRFSAMALTKEERGTIHGNNERIPLSTIAKTVEFYIRLMKKS
ncbi:MAG: M20/M25/M40 family metallo-hydrolase [Clostridia bacterium]|nr:M20/M25/M40 family metallo-hydrolase [Clostridia bacterium]